MNTVDATVVVDGELPYADTGAGRLRLPASAARPEDGAPVVVGIRPESLEVVGGDGLAATVRAVEWLGPERHVVCDVGGTTVVVREAADRPEVATGQPVVLRCAPDDVHLFDPVTTERLG